jgi:acyl-CoA thioesterase II
MDVDEDGLPALLDLQDAGDGLFIGPASREARPRVFGGQLIAQALTAASFTVDGWPCNSLHAYFLRPGKPGRPIEYEVTALRDGRNFATRRVAAIQRDEIHLELIASFSNSEGGAEYQHAMPEIPPPESFPSEEERIAQSVRDLPAPVAEMMRRPRPVEVISINGRNASARGEGEQTHRSAILYNWMRARGPIGDAPNLHRCAFAYASDMMLLEPSMRAIGAKFWDGRLQVASLDHSLWFHRPFRFDDWLLVASESTSVAGGRGFNRSSVFTREGKLVASIAQEGMMRKRDDV